MGRIAVIHQPDFLPYLGFFHRLLQADVFVILDHVQFVSHTSRSWTHRDKIKTPNGERWLSVAVEKCHHGIPINEVRLSKSIDWRQANLNLLRQNYCAASYFKEIMPKIERLYSFQGEKLVDFNIRSIKFLMKLFDIKIDIFLSSELLPSGKKNELLVELLTKVKATTYLSGVGARSYLDPIPFTEAGIKVLWQEFNHPTYPQLYGDFLTYMSSIDLLFNCGEGHSRVILRNCK